jgi:hypothetical protein
VAIPSPSSRRTGHTGPGAEFSQGNHIGVVGGDFLNDAGQAVTTAMLEAAPD